MSAIATRRWCRMNGRGFEPDEGSEFCRTHRFSANETNGRALLDRMDAGEPLTDEPELEEAAAVGERADSGSAPSLVGEPERAAVSSSPTRSGTKWTRESVIAAIREVAEKVGHTPSHAEMNAAGYSSVGVPTTLRRLGATWAELVRGAGYEPNTTAAGGRKSLGRKRNTVARPAESEREPEATDPAEAEVAPSRRALLAAEGATSRSESHPLQEPKAEHAAAEPEPAALERLVSQSPAATGEATSRPEIGPLDLIRLIEELDQGAITVTRWKNEDGDQDEATEQRIRQIMRDSLGGWCASEIGEAVIEYIDREVP